MPDEKPDRTSEEEPGAASEPKPAAARKRAPAKKAAAKPKAKAAQADDAEATPKAPRKRTPVKKAPSTEPAAEEPADVATVEEPAASEPAATPAKSSAAEQTAAAEAPLGPIEVRAHAKYVRTSARKARLVCDHIRGKSVDEAYAILAHTPRHVARDWQKLLRSAVANAEHNHELVGEDLRISSVHADEGPTLKRFRPRAMGRASSIRKRTSHLSITLAPKE